MLKALSFNRTKYPEAVQIAERLAELLDRKPHDAINRFLVNAGAAEIKRLERLKAAEKQKTLKTNQSAMAD